MSVLAKRLTAAVLIFLTLAISGCGGSKELDDMSYVLTIGVDNSDEPDKYIFSYRIAMPKVFTGDGGGDSKEKTKVVSVKSVSLSESIRELVMATGRQIELSHASALFIHESVARQGIEQFISVVLRSQVYRNNITVLITKQEVKTVLEKNSAPFEVFQYRWIDSLQRSQEFVAGFSLNDIRSFYMNMNSPERAILTGLGTVSENTLERFAAPPLAKQSVPQYQPGTVPRSGGTELLVAGSAVFRDWKMVGSLSSGEAMGAMLLGKGVNTVLNITDPLHKELSLGISIRSEKPDIDVKLTDQRMKINIVVPVECQIEEQLSQINYQHKKFKNTLEQQVGSALRGNIYAYFSATKPLGTDCLRLADYYRPKCSSYNEWAAFDWPELYKNAEVNVDVDVRMQRIGLMGRYAEEGEGL